MAGIILGARDTAMNKTNKNPSLWKREKGMTKGETQCAEEEDIWDLLIVKVPRQLQKWGRLLDYRSRTHKPSQELEIQIWEQKAYNMVFQTFPESDHVPLQTLYRGSAEEKQAADRGGCYATDEESHPARQNWCWPLGTKRCSSSQH